MGRLTKKKIDEIVRLRGEEYTQLEVAQKTGVCLKTVRKYDPESVAGSAKEWRDIKGLSARLKSLEEIVETLSALAWSYKFEKDEKYFILCPSCETEGTIATLTDKRTGKFYYGCSECGKKINYAKYFDGPLADVLFKGDLI
jgi:hypothetical protein